MKGYVCFLFSSTKNLFTFTAQKLDEHIIPLYLLEELFL